MFGGVCENENGSSYSETADLGLDTPPTVGRGAGRLGEKDDFGRPRGPAAGTSARDRAESAQKRAAGLCRQPNQVRPGLYHVWSHAKTPEDQHPRRSRRGPKADPRTGQRTRRPSGHADLGWPDSGLVPPSHRGVPGRVDLSSRPPRRLHGRGLDGGHRPSGSAAATAFPRIVRPIRRAGSCRMRGGIRIRITDSPELPLGLALQRLRELRVAVTAPDGAFGRSV